jgi:hypothetical protein
VAPLRVDVIGDITFIRSSGKNLAGICHACKLTKSIADNDFGLIIDLASLSFTLCEFHEGMLLERLLTNYLKRKKRPQTIGFTGELFKETASV